MGRRPHRVRSALLAALVLAVSSRARAQGAADPAAPAPAAPAPSPATPPGAPSPPAGIELPVLEKDEGAVYPRQAIDDKVRSPVTVVLVLALDASGAVTSATVESPQGHGFDEAAVEAAKKLVFRPAKRNGQAIAARIKHQYVFAPPSAKLAGRLADGQDDAPLAGATVRVTFADGTTREATTAADGTFRLDDLPADGAPVTIDVAAAGHDAVRLGETLDPGVESRVVLRLERANRKVLGVPPPEAPAPGDGELVEVRGKKPPREVTKRTLDQRELSRIPGTNGDALRAIQNFPGIARPPGLAGLLIVRGAAPNETQIFADGTLIPIAYHFGGLSSVIPTEALDHIDFYPGNFSAQYGRGIGGIVDIGVKAPRVDDKRPAHGLVQFDLIDVRGLVEGRIGKSGWTYLLSGRRSYVDLTVGPALREAGVNVTSLPVYYDYQAFVQKTWDRGRQTFRLGFFGSDDRLELLLNGVVASNPGVGGGLGLGTAFYRGQARYTNKLSDDTELKLLAAFGKDAIEFYLGENYFTLQSYPLSGRGELSQKLGAGAKLNVGIDMLETFYDVGVRLPPQPVPGEPPAGPFGSKPPLTLNESGALYNPAAYTEAELTPWQGARIVPGVRLDYTKSTKSWDVQPRVIARQDLTRGFPRTTVKGGVGRFTQPPQPAETTRVFGQPGLTSNRANHYAVGAEQEITRQLEVSLEGFYRQLDNLVVPRGGNSGSGAAYGLETLVRYKPDARFFGFLAYTLSRSERRDGEGQPLRLFQFDQTHILTAIGSYRLGRGWEVGGRYRLVSGSMSTPQNYGFYDLNVGAYLPQQGYPPFSERNPLFHQLDVRIDKTWKNLDKNGLNLSVYLDVLNVYNAANSEGAFYNYDSTQRSRGGSLPFLPSFGMRGEL